MTAGPRPATTNAWHGVPFASVKSTMYQQPLDFALLSSSMSADEPGAFGGMLPTDARLIVQTEDHGPLPDHVRRP